MKIVIQRVKAASVEVEGNEISRIGRGLCLLVGVEKEDTEKEVEELARKVVELRIFPDNEGKMNLSLGQVGGEIMAISQFTLAGSTRKGRRPSFDGAEKPFRAQELFNYFVNCLNRAGFLTKTGIFGAFMDVHIINEGPVTFILESRPKKEAED